MKTIIEMAHEAGGILLSDSEIFGLGFEFEIYQLERFAEIVRTDEREACAKVCEAFGEMGLGVNSAAAAIRARGNT